MARNGDRRGPRTPYVRPGSMWEDPLDGYAPKHKSQKHGMRQTLARDINKDFGDRADECEECHRKLLRNEHTWDYAGREMCHDCIEPYLMPADDFGATHKQKEPDNG